MYKRTLAQPTTSTQYADMRAIRIIATIPKKENYVSRFYISDQVVMSEINYWNERDKRRCKHKKKVDNRRRFAMDFAPDRQ